MSGKVDAINVPVGIAAVCILRRPEPDAITIEAFGREIPEA
jgi:hypothetical protein